MTEPRPFTRADLELLRRWDTPTICNALELVAPARRGRGFTLQPFVAADPALPPICGLARTGTHPAFGRVTLGQLLATRHGSGAVTRPETTPTWRSPAKGAFGLIGLRWTWSSAGSPPGCAGRSRSCAARPGACPKRGPRPTGRRP